MSSVNPKPRSPKAVDVSTFRLKYSESSFQYVHKSEEEHAGKSGHLTEMKVVNEKV